MVSMLVFHVYPSNFLDSPISQPRVPPGTSFLFCPWGSCALVQGPPAEAGSAGTGGPLALDQAAIPLYHSINLISK